MTGGEVLVALFFANALNKRDSTSAPPPPPKTPDSGNKHDVDYGKVGGTLGGLLGSALTAALGSGAAPTTTTATVTATAAGGEAGAESAVLAGSSLTLGGAFAFAWGVFFIVQFIIINVVNALRTEELRFRDKVLSLNSPLFRMHRLEVDIVEQVAKHFGRSVGSHEVEDERLTAFTRSAENGQLVRFNWPHTRTVMDNPFLGVFGSSDVHAWNFVQLAARLIAARYVFDLGTIARSFYRGWFHTATPTAWESTPLEVWAFPLVGGGQPQVPYATAHQAFRAIPGFDVDGALDAAHFSAILHVAALVQCDPGVYSPIDYTDNGYALNVYNAMGLSWAKDGVNLVGPRFWFDVGRYKLPVSALYLDIGQLKGGQPMQPFTPGGAPTSPSLTSMVAQP